MAAKLKHLLPCISVLAINRPYRLRGRHKVTVCVCLCVFFTVYHVFRNTGDMPASLSDEGKVDYRAHILKEVKPQAKPGYQQTCSERHNVVYIKAIKCASETLTSIFRRFGYLRNLSFVLPPGNKIYLGWPYQFQTGFYRENKTESFNLLCEHVVYGESVRRVMPENTVYVTSIRQPYSQFKSMFNYYNFANIVNLTSPGVPKSSGQTFRQYLENLQHYESVYKSHAAAKTRYCIPDNFSMSHNLMSYTLGFPYAHQQDKITPDAMAQWIADIDRQFSLILIVEYFDESLILLRRLLCWTWKDVLYFTQNRGNYSFKQSSEPDLESVYRKWSRVDYELYDYFNQSLWRKINRLPDTDDFHAEVRGFKAMLRDVKDFCDIVLPRPVGEGDNMRQASDNRDNGGPAYKDRLYNIVRQNRWSPAFIVKKPDCQLITNYYDILVKIKNYYDDIPVQVRQSGALKDVC